MWPLWETKAMVSSVPARKTAGRRVAISCMCHFGPTGILQSQEKLNCPKKSTQEKYLSSSIWVATTKYFRWGDLNNRSLSCSLGGYTFNIKAVAGPRSLWRHQRRSVPGHTPGFWQFFGWKQLTPVFTWLSPHIPVSLFKYPFVWGHQTYCTRAHPTPVWPHFD